MAPSRKLNRRSGPRRYESIRQHLLHDLADDGDVAKLSSADVALVDQAAVLLVRAEQLRDAVLTGNADDTVLTRVSNSAVRVLNSLRAKKRVKRALSLDQYLADGNDDQKDEA